MTNQNTDLYAYDLSIARWRKSSASAAENDCVEVATLPNGAKAIRDSKCPDRAFLCLSASQWAAFIHGLAAGEM
ncbi:DUF397 domain-containing protein [Sphaerisporangium sp. NPDC051017]|uniref:DUF397 domain-containing protein n=1 Tax=Sphaerisporangium sp. NPDC051017 TaxID=3154636 RepID=UPI0034247BD5